jgi:uncharacterized OsmC-like protein
MKPMNNVNLAEICKFSEEIKKNSTKGRQTILVEGEWNLDEKKPLSYSSTVAFGEGKKTTFETEHAVFAGGGGRLPAPLQFGYFWVASCFAGTYAIVASFMGIELNRLKTRVEADINWSKVFEVGNEPIIEQIRIVLEVSAEKASEEDLERVKQKALEICPAIVSMRSPIELTCKLAVDRKEQC